MSKELAFTDDNDVVKYLDTTTAFNLALTADGVAFNLTNAKSVLVKIANDDGYIMQQTIDLTAVTSPLGGTLSFPINQDIMNTLVPDDYDIEVWVTMNDGTQAIFPSDGTLGFSIEDNLMSDTGEVIPTITLNDFQQQFDDLSSQMENAVHNVQKGDQGNPGNGIKATNNQYQLSDSPVTVPTGGWSDTILATTDQLPYLWTKIIFIYDDGTTKEINFVSSRGDTGSQGPMGPVGPQGKQGNGLVVRGKADKKENLPTMGNNQGDGYLVGTELYIWIDGSWQNMGSITPDLADYVKVADMNNALNTKVNVTDMRKPAGDVAGIEEVNAKQDAIGYTPADDSKVVHTSGDEEIAGAKTFDTAPIDKATGHPYITKDGVPAVPDTLADTTKDANFMGKLQKSGIDVATTSDVSSVVNTATANMANTTKLANFTAGLQVNGKDVGAGGGDTLTTPWVTTNHFGHGANDLDSLGIEEITGWRIKNDVLYYDATFMRNDTDLSSLTVVFDLYTAIPNFKTTFKTTENGPHMMFIGVGNAKAMFNFGSDFVPNNIGNIQIMLSGENASLPIHIVYPLDRL
ncbi:hypothetical protein EFM54_01595 [Lentilactobacillus buchneri]|uniref:phage baseplate upper protein n=1 Tax=Lentilactobacillus buchneri TaxID=1581 RepID=UPI0021A3B248|nr:phage baseplate upper protein [Lentilactobacillus buchneri]MCT2897722.1 hypothetical protein [Lentilactobacillus buchneri]